MRLFEGVFKALDFKAAAPRGGLLYNGALIPPDIGPTYRSCSFGMGYFKVLAMKEFYLGVFGKPTYYISGLIQYFLLIFLFPRFLAAGKLKKLKEKVSPFLFGSFAAMIVSVIGIIYLLRHLDISGDLKDGLPTTIVVASPFCQFGIFIAGLVYSVRLERKGGQGSLEGGWPFPPERGWRILELPPREIKFRMNKKVWGFLGYFFLMNALFVVRGRTLYDEMATKFFGKPALISRFWRFISDPPEKFLRGSSSQYPDRFRNSPMRRCLRRAQRMPGWRHREGIGGSLPARPKIGDPG